MLVDYAKWLLYPAYRGWWSIRIVLVDGVWTYPTGWHIEGDLPNQVAVSTGSTVMAFETINSR